MSHCPPTGPTPISPREFEEADLLRQRIATLEDVVRRMEKEVGEKQEKLLTLQNKTAEWKEKVKELTGRDRERIAVLEGELKAMRILRENADIPITEELQLLVEKSLSVLRGEYKQQLEGKHGELSAALSALSDSESKLGESHRAFDDLQQKYVQLQQRFANEMESLTAHHEKEKQQLQERLGDLGKVAALERHVQVQRDEIKTLENHFIQQTSVTAELQKEIAELRLANDTLQEKLDETSSNLTIIKEKQQQWKNTVKARSIKDAETIQSLRRELDTMKLEETQGKMAHSFNEGTMLQWDQKEIQDKPNNEGKIQSPTQNIHNSSREALEANKLIQTIATMLTEVPFNISDCIRVTNKYLETMQDNHKDVEHQITRNQNELLKTTGHMDPKEKQDCGSADAADLQARLDEAVQRRDEAEQKLELTAAELDALRARGSADAADLQARLDEAVQRREYVEAECSRLENKCSLVETEYQAIVEEKVTAMRALESKVLLWKEKVMATKLKDDTRIEELESALASLRDDVRKLYRCLRDVFSLMGECLANDAGVELSAEFDITACVERVDAFGLRLAESLKLFFSSEGSVSLLELLASLNAKLNKVQAERDEFMSALECCRLELEKIRSQLHEAEVKTSLLPTPEVVAELELKNSRLEEKCELLRKEIRRQRESFQQERAQCGVSSTAMVREEDGATLRVSAGGVFEDMLLLANQKNLRDSEICRLRTQLQTLEEENAELKRECEHNNVIVAQYTKDIEVLKAKERVQQSVEYVRNVILQFLSCPSENIRLKMMPAIAAVLEFTPNEKMAIQRANPACPRLQ